VDDERVRPALGHDERAVGGRGGRRWKRRRYGRPGNRRGRRGRSRRYRAHARPQPPGGEHLVEKLSQLLGIGIAEGNDLELVQRHFHVHQLDDVEHAPDVGGRVRDDEEVRLTMGGDAALLGHEGAEESHGVRGVYVPQRDELGQDLVAAARGIRFASDHGSDRSLGRALLRDDAIEIARLDGGQAVDVEDGQQHVEDVVGGDLPDGLDRHLPAARRGGQHVVEADDLGGGLDDHLHVGIVEVENDVTRRSG
jgi:hypothetical protein